MKTELCPQMSRSTIFAVLFFLVTSIPCLADQPWVTRYDGSASGIDATANNIDDFMSHSNLIAVDSEGNVYVTGASAGLGTRRDYATVKYDSSGNPSASWPNVGFGVGVRRYSGPANQDDYPYAIAVDVAGNVYVTGRSDGTAGSYAVTIKYDANGNPSADWPDEGSGVGVRRYQDARAIDLVVDQSGNVYVAGSVYGGSTGRDIIVVKYDPNGNLSPSWIDMGFGVGVRRYNRTSPYSDLASDLLLDEIGNIYLVGYSSGSTGFADYITIKYDANGNSAWSDVGYGAGVRIFNGPANGHDYARAGFVDISGNVYVTGSGVVLHEGRVDVDSATIKYDSNGNLSATWQDDGFGDGVRLYNGTANFNDFGYSISADSSGNVYVLCDSYGGSNWVTLSYSIDGIPVANWPSNDYAVIKYDSTGAPSNSWPDIGFGVGVRRYNHLINANNTDSPRSMIVTDSGDVYVTGISYDVNTGYDFATIKYDVSGNLSATWADIGFGSGIRRHNGPANGTDLGTAMVLDEFGNVFVTGSSQGNGTNFDFATVRISANGDSDADGDTVVDSEDNCLTTINSVQNDHDVDTLGDACDNDFLPAPILTSLSPSTVLYGGPAFTLTVTGSNFFEGKSIIRWNNVDRPTAFISETQLSTQISAQDIATQGFRNVSVITSSPGGGTSNTLSFLANLPPATLTIEDMEVISSSQGVLQINVVVFVQPSWQQRGTVTFSFATASGTATEYNPSTQEGDFEPASGTIDVGDWGLTRWTFPILIHGRQIPPEGKEFYVDIFNPVNATIGRSRGTITLRNHDTQPPAQSRLVGVASDGTLSYVDPQTAAVSPISTLIINGEYNASEIQSTVVDSASHNFYYTHNWAGTFGLVLRKANTQTGASEESWFTNFSPILAMEADPSTGQLFVLKDFGPPAFGTTDFNTGEFTTITELPLDYFSQQVIRNRSAFDVSNHLFYFLAQDYYQGTYLLGRINTQTGATLIAPTFVSDVRAMEFDPQTGKLLVISNDQFGTINPNTGFFEPLITIPFPVTGDIYNSKGSGFHPATRRFFAISEDSNGRHIVTINVDTLQVHQSPVLNPNIERIEFETLIEQGQINVNQSLEIFSAPAGESAGARVTFTNNTAGTGTATVLVEPLGSVPGKFKIGAGDVYVDVQAIGVDSTDTASVKFYYPESLDSQEPDVTLQYFNTVSQTYEPVLSSGGAAVSVNTANNQDGTVSGGSITVVFDSTSTPKITELNGIATQTPGETQTATESRMVALTSNGTMAYINTQTGEATAFTNVFSPYSIPQNLWPQALNAKSHVMYLIQQNWPYTGNYNLISVDTVSGEKTFAQVNSTNAIYDLEADPVTNQLFALKGCCPAQLGTIDLATGAFTATHDIPLDPGHNIYSVSTIDPKGHRFFFFYGSGIDNYVASIDTQTGSVTSIASFPISGFNPDSLSGFEFDEIAQKLYVLTTTELWSLDLATQQFGTPVTTLYSSRWAAFHTSTRRLLVVADDLDGQHIVTINVDTMETSLSPALNPQINPFWVFEFEAIVETTEVAVNQTTETSNAPDDPGEAGITATLTNNTSGSGTATVTVENLGSVAGDFELGEDASYVDLRATGVDAGDVLNAKFYYASTLDSEEPNVVLRYLNPASQLYEPVLSSGGTAVAPDTQNNQDDTVSGGSFSVVFDNTSTPKITELTGTIFAFVAPEITTTLLVSAPNPSQVGQAVTLVAHVNSESSSTPTGFVTFTDNGSVIGAVQLENGEAELVISTLTAGSHTIRATYVPANNFVGSTSAPLTQLVQSSTVYNFTGFFSPVDNLPVSNRVKAGSGVPVKFSLNGNQGMNILASGSPSSVQINCSTSSVDDIEQTVSASNSGLTYDAATDQYTYVWKTEKSWAGKCRQLTITLNDGTQHKANFTFVK